MANQDSMKLLESTLRPYISFQGSERRCDEQFGAAMDVIKAVDARIDARGQFSFPEVAKRTSCPLDKLLFQRSQSVRGKGVGVLISASQPPKLPAWAGSDAYASIIQGIRGQTLSGLLTSDQDPIVWTHDTLYILVNSAIEHAFERWNKDRDGFAYDWMPQEMQQELRSGVLLALAGLMLSITRNAGYNHQRLASLVSGFPTRIPWREGGHDLGDWLIVTG